LRLFAVACLAAVALPSAADAQPVDLMLNDCSNVARTFFRDHEARTDMRYNGQRTDGTHAVGGRILLETRAEHFACSFDGSGRRMTEFFAEGRSQPGFLPGEAAPPSGTGLARVANVPANDVLNLRSGPGTGYPVIGALSNGTTVRLLQCAPGSGPRWCEIEMMTDMRERGWVNARFLDGAQGAALQQPGPTVVEAHAASATHLRIPAGATGTRLSHRRAPGATRRSPPGARRDRRFPSLEPSVAGGAPGWRLPDPEGAMRDAAWTAGGYRGDLRQTGDHVALVTNRGTRVAVRSPRFTTRSRAAGPIAIQRRKGSPCHTSSTGAANEPKGPGSPPSRSSRGPARSPAAWKWTPPSRIPAPSNAGNAPWG
jgi:uncharacterized protein YgiM (DUF1202 family)